MVSFKRLVAKFPPEKYPASVSEFMWQRDMNRGEPAWINYFYVLSIAGFAFMVTFAVYVDLTGHLLQEHRQIPDLRTNLGGKTVREHCTYCHPEGRRPAADLSQYPTAEHPDIAPHQWEKLGCTGCHLGEGMALDLEISHGLPGLEARKVLKGKDLQASCFRCHLVGPLPGAEKAWQGYRTFHLKGCTTCHHVSGLGRGGRYGPDLSHVGSLLGVDPIQQAIRDPKADPPNSIMPRFPLSKGQARNVAYFLKNRVKDPFYATPMQLQAGQVALPPVDLLPPGRELADGEKLLFQKQCLACHRFREVNGRVAPDLSFVGSQRSREYIAGFLERPTLYIPDAVMPQILMSAQERSLLVEYLAAKARAPENLPLLLAERLGREEPAKQLFMRLCQSCHAAEGNGRGPLQPNLANFPRAFAGNPEFFRRIEQQRLLHSLDIGVPGTSMPGYGKILTPQQREDLLQLIFEAFIGIAQTDKAQLASLPTRPVRTEVAEKLFQQRCSRCHGATGTGRGEEALQHLPRPRNLTNRPYFGSIKDERIARAISAGIAGTAMPAFAQELSAAELWGLVAKVRQLSKGGGR